MTGREPDARSAGILEFLNARLDEDRAVAREAAGLTECWVAEEPAIGVVLVDGEPLIEGHITGLTAHIARHDPARVLREVEAGRKLLAAYRRAEQDTPVSAWESDYTQALEWAVRNRAAVYSDHPDYQPEWSPPTLETP